MRTIFNFVALDIETTGFDPVNEEIIEIGAVRFENGNRKDDFSVFVKPQKKVPQFIKQLTQITDQQLNSGLLIAEALSQMKEFLQDDILVCHNASFDIGFLNSKLEKFRLSKIDNHIYDTLELSRIYLPFIFNHKLSTVADHFQIDSSRAHRAIYDAEATASILLKILDFIDEHISLPLNNRIMEVAKFANLETNLIEFLDRIIEHQKKNVLLKTEKPQKIEFQQSNFIEHKPEKVIIPKIEDIFGKNGSFDKMLTDYEIRDGQIEMAEEIEDCLEKEEFLLVEAGTGVGKTFAYLIPAIKFSHRKQAKIIISTNTKNLQEQLFFKDIPTVKSSIEVPFRAALLKGRRNYICQKKWEEAVMQLGQNLNEFDAKNLLFLIIWKEFTQTGDISENSSFNLKFAGSLWRKLAADRHLCRGKKCSFFRKCYLMNIRLKAAESNLVVINHHLLLADMQSENSVLGEFEHLIIDEAHNLPHLAPSELGLSLGYADISNFFSLIFNRKSKFQTGILPHLRSAATKSAIKEQDFFKRKIDEIIELLDENDYIFRDFFSRIGNTVETKGSYGKLRIKNAEQFPFLDADLGNIIQFLEKLSRTFIPLRDTLSNINSSVFIDYHENLDNIKGIIDRINEFYDNLSKLHNPEFRDFAYWMENFKTYDEKYPNGVLNYAPLNIGNLFHELLYENADSIVFTSATMAIRGKFKYYSNRMGLNLVEKGLVREKIVNSPFDFRKQTKIIVTGFLPDPKDKFFRNQSLSVIKNAVNSSRKGTMVLFTSYRDLNFTYENVSDEFYRKNILLLAQGKGIDRSVMLKEFKNNRNAVLLGTNSFWEGIDVPGESLSLLILYKLPFLVPSEPIVEAYLEKLRKEGKDSFMHYMLPNALLKYRQGFGRLIRNKTDKGLVLVLDNRILTKKYGQFFIENVPTRTITASDPVEISDHLGKWFSEI